jgi:hypothetical protein
VADGFSVDLDALHKAAEGVTDTLNAVATKKVSDIQAPKAAFGHDELADTVADFCGRWEIGVEHLSSDGQQIVDRLNRSVLAYDTVEREAHHALTGILQRSTGSDPAAE